MKESLEKFITWARSHTWLTGMVGTAATVSLGAVIEGLIKGEQSYALAMVRSVASFALTWHSFPVLAWAAIAPLSVLGILWIRDKVRGPVEKLMPDESHGVRWRYQWNDRRRIVNLEPICPNPNCGLDLKTFNAGGYDECYTLFACNNPPGCGFMLHLKPTPQIVLADVRRDLENQAKGQPPASPKQT